MEFVALMLTATLFGGMMLYSFGFAALVFKIMPAERAGETLRKAFPYYYLFTIFAAAVAAFAVVMIDGASAVLLFVTALLSVYARQVLMGWINTARDEEVAGKEGAKARFDWLHGISVAIGIVQIVIVAYVLARFL